MILSDTQLDFITEELKKWGLSYQPLEEEMIDHFACLVETEMEKGDSFLEAMEKVFGKMETKQLSTIEQETISLQTYKTTTLQSVSSFMAACAALLLFGLFIYQTPILPDEKEYAEQTPTFLESVPTAIFVNQVEPPSRSPLGEDLKITSGFGMRFHPIFKERKMHRGVDLKAKMGTPVYATADGVVLKAITHNKYGKMIVLKHDDTYQTLYAQLSAFDIKTGTAVKKGDLIGRVGSSGLSTAPHLHYEVLKDGKAVNPEKYF